MSCRPPEEYADPRDMGSLAEPLRSRMHTAMIHAKRAGGSLWLVSGLRTRWQQYLLRQAHGCAGRECDRTCKGTPVTALPGVKNDDGVWISGSKHQRGEAADMGGSLTWLYQNRYAFGLEKTVSTEPWHYEAKGEPTVAIIPWPQQSLTPAKWVPFRPGDTRASIIAKGGLDNEIAEVQIRLKALGYYGTKGDWSDIDNDYGPKSQAGVKKFHADIVALQVAYGQTPWGAPDANVGPKKIAMLRFFTP